MKKRAIFSLKLAGLLTRRGFTYLGKAANRENPKLWVYYYEDTKELDEFIRVYTITHSKHIK